jgi:hypothetical protein
MEPDYIAKAGEIRAEFRDTLKKMIKPGQFWGND